jgi:Flp pilus assembly protein TadG
VDPSGARGASRGQSVVEFALVLPLLVFLLFAIVDLARIYTTMLSVESAAREAADFGSFGSQKWNAAVIDVPVNGTLAEMTRRACRAASNLPGYVGPDTGCTNPSPSFALSADKGATWSDVHDATLGCDIATREPPCWVRATLSYNFDLFVPLHVDLFGVRLGLPTTITFQRSSIYPMSDLELP